jgi:hypothetical protein
VPSLFKIGFFITTYSISRFLKKVKQKTFGRNPISKKTIKWIIAVRRVTSSRP